MMKSIKQVLIELEEDPKNYNLIVQAGNVYFDIQQYNQALKYYIKAISIQVDENVLIDLGVCYFNLGKLDSALVTLEDALKHNPNHKKGLYNIGIVLYNLGHFNGALKNWQHLIYIHPNTEEADQVQQYINEIKNNTQIGT